MMREEFIARIMKIRKLKNNIFLICLWKNKYVQARVDIKEDKDSKKKFHYNDIIIGKGFWETSSQNIATFKLTVEKIVKNNLEIDNKKRIFLNEEQRIAINIKNIVFCTIRSFLLENNYAEVNSSIMKKEKGSTGAHCIKAIGEYSKEEFILKRNCELDHKRIIANTMLDIFEFEILFRDQGRSRTTMKEYQMVDIYKIGRDYNYAEKIMMRLMDEIKKSLYSNGYPIPNYIKENIRNYEFIDLINMYFNDTMDKPCLENYKKVMLKLNEINQYNDKLSYWQMLEKIFSHEIKPHLKNAIVKHFPYELSPLAKRKHNTLFAEEWKYIINGVSIGHSYTEETDPIIIQKNLYKQYSYDPANLQLETEMIEILKYGLPQCVGIGIGLNRLICALTNIRNVRNTYI